MPLQCYLFAADPVLCRADHPSRSQFKESVGDGFAVCIPVSLPSFRFPDDQFYAKLKNDGEETTVAVMLGRGRKSSLSLVIGCLRAVRRDFS